MHELVEATVYGSTILSPGLRLFQADVTPTTEHLATHQDIAVTPGSEIRRRALAQKAIDIAARTPLPQDFSNMAVRTRALRGRSGIAFARLTCVSVAGSATATAPICVRCTIMLCTILSFTPQVVSITEVNVHGADTTNQQARHDGI
jgi:hypothetical protein